MALSMFLSVDSKELPYENRYDHPRATEHEGLRRHFDMPLRIIARQAVRSWFNRPRLDRVLADSISTLPDCELLYAIDADGRQVSSNIHADSIDQRAYGQDLSRRPWAVSLSVLNNAAFRGAFLCDPYISQITRRPCVTVMYGVTSGSSLLGYIAADFRQGIDGS